MDWSSIYKNIGTLNLDKLIKRPDEWQVILSEKLRQYTGTGSILEAGCGFGVTSLLIGMEAQRTLLDLEPKAIETARKLFDLEGQHANFEVGNLFNMNFPDNKFDVVFNAGVMEHFDKYDRCEALREMVRVTKPGGIVCVAIPNHYSVPYRFSYESRKSRGKWPYPDEEKIYDLAAELREVGGVVMVSRDTIGERTMFHFLSKPQKIWFKILHSMKGFEGYLTILTHEKLGEEKIAGTGNRR